jgi:energy-converting hydrogenase Eha subunit G
MVDKATVVFLLVYCIVTAFVGGFLFGSGMTFYIMMKTYFGV